MQATNLRNGLGTEFVAVPTNLQVLLSQPLFIGVVVSERLLGDLHLEDLLVVGRRRLLDAGDIVTLAAGVVVRVEHLVRDQLHPHPLVGLVW